MVGYYAVGMPGRSITGRVSTVPLRARKRLVVLMLLRGAFSVRLEHLLISLWAHETSALVCTYVYHTIDHDTDAAPKVGDSATALEVVLSGRARPGVTAGAGQSPREGIW